MHLQWKKQLVQTHVYTFSMKMSFWLLSELILHHSTAFLFFLFHKASERFIEPILIFMKIFKKFAKKCSYEKTYKTTLTQSAPWGALHSPKLSTLRSYTAPFHVFCCILFPSISKIVQNVLNSQNLQNFAKKCPLHR